MIDAPANETSTLEASRVLMPGAPNLANTVSRTGFESWISKGKHPTVFSNVMSWNAMS
jgi:hypothetical protein